AAPPAPEVYALSLHDALPISRRGGPTPRRCSARSSGNGEPMPRTIRFHLDENCSKAIAEGLRRRGVEVTTTPQAGLLGATDEEQDRKSTRLNSSHVSISYAVF